MGSYLVRRFLLMVLTLFGMSVLIFVMLRLVPGNIADILVDASGADPKEKDDRLVVVDLRSGKKLARPVTLAEIRAEPALRDLALVRMPRLSVVPATEAQWRKLMLMGER